MGERVRIIHGDCMAVLPSLPADSVHAVVTDPPYHLTSIVKRFGKETPRSNMESGDEQPPNRGAQYKRLSKGFMGKQWDGGDIAFRPDLWREVLRVLKPGGHVLAFGSTRTYHRLACAVEDAGFEIRDAIMWHYSTGFPKAHNLKNNPELFCLCGGDTVPYAQSNSEHNLRSVRRGDLSAPVHGQDQQGQVLFPCLPEQGLSKHGTTRAEPGAGGAEQPGLGGRPVHRAGEGVSADPSAIASANAQEWLRSGAHHRSGEDVGAATHGDGGGPSHQRQEGGQPAGEFEGVRQPHGTLDGGTLRDGHACPRCGKLPEAFKGFSTALKPATEILVLARKPLGKSTVAANVLAFGTGALNIDGCRVETGGEDRAARYGGLPPKGGGANINFGERAEPWAAPAGRWPANVLHDGSEEVLRAFPESAGGAGGGQSGRPSIGGVSVYGGGWNDGEGRGARATHDSGSAARFFKSCPFSEEERRLFYTSKADAADRLGSSHPTVKPVSLIRYLCRLITPPGGTILDCFAGSGTLAFAAMAEGFNAILIEREAEYVADIRRRIAHVSGQDAPLFAQATP